MTTIDVSLTEEKWTTFRTVLTRNEKNITEGEKGGRDTCFKCLSNPLSVYFRKQDAALQSRGINAHDGSRTKVQRLRVAIRLTPCLSGQVIFISGHGRSPITGLER